MVKSSQQKTLCRTPTPNKKPVRIDTWKFDLVRKKILKIVPKHGDGIRFMDLPELVGQLLSKEERETLGSVGWYTTAVKLEMEVAGELKRIARSSPQRLLRA